MIEQRAATSVADNLDAITRLAPSAVAYMRANGFRIEAVGPLAVDTPELDRWQVLAFSLYTDLVIAGALAQQALDAGMADALHTAGVRFSTSEAELSTPDPAPGHARASWAPARLSTISTRLRRLIEVIRGDPHS